MKKYFSICLLLICFYSSYSQQAFNSAGSAGLAGNFGLVSGRYFDKLAITIPVTLDKLTVFEWCIPKTK